MDELRMLTASGLAATVGLALIFSHFRWFRRPSLVARLQPFVVGAASPHASPSSVRSRALPLADRWGTQLASLFGARADLNERLALVDDPRTSADFRLHQLLTTLLALMGAGLGAAALRPPMVMTLLLVVGTPLLAFLVVEQHLASRVSRRKQQLFRELPVVSEQLAMLLGAGYSLGSALQRLGARGDGVIHRDFRTVHRRLQQGVPVDRALTEWSHRVGQPEVHRLVKVIGAGSEASDLGRLVSGEAATIRLEAQRRLSEVIERRAQQVWVPVTVATLVPGVIFLCIPFLQALQLFSGV